MDGEGCHSDGHRIKEPGNYQAERRSWTEGFIYVDARSDLKVRKSLDGEGKCCIAVVRALRHHGPVEPKTSLRHSRLFNDFITFAEDYMQPGGSKMMEACGFF